MEKPELTDEQKPIRHQISAYARVSTDTPCRSLLLRFSRNTTRN